MSSHRLNVRNGPKRSGLRLFAVSVLFMFCTLSVFPFVDAAAEITFVKPIDGEKLSRTAELEVKVRYIHPSSVGLFIDGLYISDMFEKGYDGTYWHYKYTLNTWGLSDGPHFMRVVARDVGSPNSTGYSFFVDNRPPTITNVVIKYPEGQLAAKKGDRITITAKVSDNVSGVASVVCDASKLLASDSLIMRDDGQHNDSIQNDGIFGTDTITANVLTNGYNIIQIKVTDKMGNQWTTTGLVAMDNHPPDFTRSIVVYPTGQSAAKLGDDVRIVTTVEDKGEGGILRVGTDIVLVLDNSGSMINGVDPPMNYLKAAVNNFLNVTNPEDRIAIFGFASNEISADRPYDNYEDAYRYMDFTPMTDSGKQSIRDLLDSPVNEFNYAHNTPIWDTIGAAIEYAVSYSVHKPVVVAMTDGTDYGYDWYDRPDPSWWQAAYNAGYYGIGFERGSETYCPWNNWGTRVKYTTHYGEYPAPWVGDSEVHSFDVPMVDNTGYDYSGSGSGYMDRDWSDGWRSGLLNATVPVFTVGLGLPHHDPIMANTTEYDLFKIATTSENSTIKGRYYYAPLRGDLADIYSDISFFINLAGDINTTPPGGIKSLAMAGQAVGVSVDKPMVDDGSHDDVFKNDSTFGTDLFQINSRITEYVNVTLNAKDISNQPAKTLVELKIDNTPPVIEDLVANILDPKTMTLVNRTYAKDDDKIFFTVNASDWGRVRGLTKVVLDATPLGGDPVLLMKDDGNDTDQWGGDGVFTSPMFDVKSGGVNGFILENATAFDIANNQASVTGPVLVLNALDVIGQIVQPLNNSVVTGNVDVRLVVSDDKPLIGAELMINAKPVGGLTPIPVKLMMAHGSEKDIYIVAWNTTLFADGAYDLLCYMSNKGGFKIPTATIRVYVDNTRPVVDIEKPKNGDIVTNITELLALVYDPPRTYNGGDNLTSVTYLLDNGTFLAMSLKGGSDVGGPHYILNIDPFKMMDGPHKVTVVAVDRVGLRAMDNVTFFTDTQPPFIKVVYVPSTSQNTSGTTMFDFQVEDTTGVEGGTLVIDAGKKGQIVVPMYLNSTSGLWEYSLDTTKLGNGEHNYTVEFKDKAGQSSVYGSKFIVSNEPVKPPKKITRITELPWWYLVLMIILLSCLLFSIGILVREWNLKRAARMEDEQEMVDKATRRARAEGRGERIPVPKGETTMEELDNEPEGDHGTDLPDDMPPPELPPDLPPLIEPVKKTKHKGRPTIPEKGRMEVSSIAPAPVTEPVQAPMDEPPVQKRPKKVSKKVIKCPMCMFKIPVESDERPLVLTCSKCGAKGMLK